MIKDETGKQFGRLTVIERAENYKDGSARWVCKCSCGKISTQKGVALRNGVVISCGCYNKELHTKHLMCFTPEYKTWQSMKERCHNPNSKNYHAYGGRGIFVCEKWRDSFEAFFADMGKRSKGMSIDRIDNNGPYSPKNCRWATHTLQSNNRRSSKFITRGTETKSISEWSRILGVTPQCISGRISKSSDVNYILSGRKNTHGKLI